MLMEQQERKVAAAAADRNTKPAIFKKCATFKKWASEMINMQVYNARSWYGDTNV